MVIVLALGIGATTAMFSAVDAALLKPLPFPHPEQLVTLPDVDIPFDPGPGQQFPKSDTHILDINDVNAMPSWFSSAAGWAVGGLNLSDPQRPIRLTVGVVTVNFFTTLGVHSAVGRAFAADEGHPGSAHVAVLSWGLWQRQFGGREMVNRAIRLNNASYVVIGVMPRGFSFPQQSDLWIPMTVPTTFETFEAFKQYLPSSVIARLGPGATRQAASHQLMARWRQGLAPGIHREADSTGYVHIMLNDLERRGTAWPLQQTLVGGRGAALKMLLGATGLLLLIACANAANLLLSQANTRRREVAVREVLGATRGRVIRQLLTESVMLAAAGTLIGLLLAPAALHLIHNLMPANLVGVASATVNLRLLAFATGLALTTGIALGLWPALGMSRGDLSSSIKSGGGRGATGGTLGPSRRLLVGAELALTVMLLIGAGLMLRSFTRLLSTDSGMNVEHVGTLQLAFPKESSRAAERTTLDAILDRLQMTPGVTAAGAVNNLPLAASGGILLSITADDEPAPTDDDFEGAENLVVSGDYFRTMGIRLLAGRTFTASDDSNASRVAIISAGVAEHDWPGTSPLGRTFHTGPAAYTVVGVVSDVHDQELARQPLPQMYFPMSQEILPNLAVVARGSLAPGALIATMRTAVHDANPSLASYHEQMMGDVMSESLAPQRTNTLLITVFAALAFVLGAVGVGAVVSYGVTQRHRELGIRAALGASGSDLVGLLSREMALVALIGVGVGLAGAWALAHVMASLIYGVTIHDPATFVAVPVALLLAAATATYLPARRALRVNPVDVMRAE